MKITIVLFLALFSVGAINAQKAPPSKKMVYKYLMKGDKAAKEGNHKTAIEYYSMVIDADENHADAYYKRGSSKIALHQYERAIPDFSMVIELGNRGAHVYYYRGFSKLEAGRYKGAIDDFDKVIKLTHNHTHGNTTDLGAYGYHELATNKRKLAIKKLAELNSNQPQTHTNQTHIVSVGISNYQYADILSALNYPIIQVKDFERIMEESGQADDVVHLTNPAAHYQNILQTLEATFCNEQRVGSEDLVIFYFTGHGVAVGDKIGICPYDYFDQGQLITDADILDVMERSPAKHKVVIIEACKSTAQTTMGTTQELSTSQIDRLNQARHAITGGIVYLTSTQPGTPSLELTNFGGIFSQFFLKAVKGDADNDKDHIISSRELFDYLEKKVKEKSQGKQVPQINTAGYQLDVPIFVVK